MAKLRRSPFKANTVENDPQAFGLRVKEIITCAEALYNSRSILISGPRGIGKSSLGNQLQKILSGDHTLLSRCDLEASFPSTLCVFYACGRDNTLDQIARDIAYNVEQKCLTLPNLRSMDIKPTFELNFGFLKTTLELGVKLEELPPATIANQLVAGLSSTIKLLEKIGSYKQMNIMIDELDRVSSKDNFGHFMKIVHETLVNQDLQNITFILAGQQGIYSRMIEEDPSFERIVKHIPLSTLDEDSSDYILSFASNKLKPPFRYERRAKELILALSSGYPYVIHLIGDSSFASMQIDEWMTQSDVINGIETILKSDKREKYQEMLKDLSENERRILAALSVYKSDSIPVMVPSTWLSKIVGKYKYFKDEEELNSTVNLLAEKGYLVIHEKRAIYRFAEELFRVFISLNRIEQSITSSYRSEKEKKKTLEQSEDDALLNALLEVHSDRWDQMSEIERNRSIREIMEALGQSDYNMAWDQGTDDIISLDDDHDY